MFKSLFVLLLISFSYNSYANTINKVNVLNELSALEKSYPSKPVRIGISAYYLEKGKNFSFRGNEKFILASTMKVPTAIYALKLIEEGKLNLKQEKEIKTSDLVPGGGPSGYFLTHNPIKLSLADLMETMITVSDNTSTDAVIELVGGIKPIREYFKEYNKMSIDRNMMDLLIDYFGTKKGNDYSLVTFMQKYKSKSQQEKDDLARKFFIGQKTKDYTTPNEMNKLLIDFMNGKFVNEESKEFLISVMQRTEGKNRIAGNLNLSAVKVANKTGSIAYSGKNYSYHPYNDIGIITLQNGDHIIMSVYVDTLTPENALEKENVLKLMSLASRIVYDYLYFCN